MVQFDVPTDDETDEENPDDTFKDNPFMDLRSARSDAFKAQAERHKSTMTILTMDNEKEFYSKEYKKEHIGESREYWRDMILGVNDGLVSTFLLVTGVYGSDMSAKNILLTSIAGLFAGAISMAAGEYVATKTQEEVKRAEYELEKKAIAEHKTDELRHLNDLLTKIGIPEAENNESEEFAVRRALLGYYSNHDEAHLKINVALAFGDVESAERSPWIAAALAYCLFTAGALPSVIPFALTDDRESAFIAAFVATLTFIMLVGGVKTWATKGVWWMSALENLIITCAGGCVSYVIGVGFDSIVNN